MSDPNTASQEYDAELRNWIYNGVVVYGEIYNDTKGRFVDGQQIRTSKIVSIEDGIATTLNTRYKLAQ